MESEIYQPVPQEHPLGCAVACVASRCGMTYQRALTLFEKKENAWTRGYYCPEVVEALSQLGLRYCWKIFNSKKHVEHLQKPGTIVFVQPCAKYPMGHFFLRSQKGWMNPWENHPKMIPVKSGFEKSLPGEISHIIFQT